MDNDEVHLVLHRRCQCTHYLPCVLVFSKYSELKLGKDDEKPEFSDATYFTMLFAAGIGIGLFYFSVTEPISHYSAKDYKNRYWARYVFYPHCLPVLF